MYHNLYHKFFTLFFPFLLFKKNQLHPIFASLSTVDSGATVFLKLLSKY